MTQRIQQATFTVDEIHDLIESIEVSLNAMTRQNDLARSAGTRTDAWLYLTMRRLADMKWRFQTLIADNERATQVTIGLIDS